jgi:signal transduction histidine kinase
MTWVRKDGQKIFTRISPRPIFDGGGQFQGSFAIITDITERKIAEDALGESEKQLRYLSSQLLTAQETERRRISKELHDELGQTLALLKLRLDHVEKNLPKDQAGLGEEYEHILQDVDNIIKSVRNLARNLSPYVLEYFGITIALQRLINDFVKSNGMKVALDIFSMDHLFSKDAQFTIYRIVCRDLATGRQGLLLNRG